MQLVFIVFATPQNNFRPSLMNATILTYTCLVQWLYVDNSDHSKCECSFSGDNYTLNVKLRCISSWSTVHSYYTVSFESSLRKYETFKSQIFKNMLHFKAS